MYDVLQINNCKLNGKIYFDVLFNMQNQYKEINSNKVSIKYELIDNQYYFIVTSLFKIIKPNYLYANNIVYEKITLAQYTNHESIQLFASKCLLVDIDELARSIYKYSFYNIITFHDNISNLMDEYSTDSIILKFIMNHDTYYCYFYCKELHMHYEFKHKFRELPISITTVKSETAKIKREVKKFVNDCIIRKLTL